MTYRSSVDVNAHAASTSVLQRLYANRFAKNTGYRDRIWKVLAGEFFSRWILTTDSVLDLGSGYGEFINNVRADHKYAMDLNPDAGKRLSESVSFLQHDSTQAWPIMANTLDIVFSSNFFEHLPDKAALSTTLQETFRCLKPGGRLIAIGPNIRYLPGHYWDFYDHHVPLTESSLTEALIVTGFNPEVVTGRFLPYTAVNSPEYPLLFLRLYLAFPFAWPFLGKQFLVVVSKPRNLSAER